MQVPWRQMVVALDHPQHPPPAQLLDREQINARHDQLGGEGVPVGVPDVDIEVRCILPCPLHRGLRLLHGAREEDLRLARPRRADLLVWVIGPLALAAEINEDSTGGAVIGTRRARPCFDRVIVMNPVNRSTSRQRRFICSDHPWPRRPC